MGGYYLRKQYVLRWNNQTIARAASCLLLALTHPGVNICTGRLLLHQQMDTEGEGVGGGYKGSQASAGEVPGGADMVQCGVPCAGPEDPEDEAGKILRRYGSN